MEIVEDATYTLGELDYRTYDPFHSPSSVCALRLIISNPSSLRKRVSLRVLGWKQEMDACCQT